MFEVDTGTLLGRGPRQRWNKRLWQQNKIFQDMGLGFLHLPCIFQGTTCLCNCLYQARYYLKQKRKGNFNFVEKT